MTVRGFTLDPQDPTKRLPMDYTSKEERALCECQELVDAGFFKEANDKFSDYYKYSRKYKFSWRDMLLLARINLGLAKDSGDKDTFDRAIEQICDAIARDMGGNNEEIVEVMDTAIEARIEQLIPVKEKYVNEEKWCSFHADYEKASAKNLLLVAEAILQILDTAIENDMWLAVTSENLFDIMHPIIDALVNKKKWKKVVPIVEHLLQVDQTNFYEGIADGWKEQFP